jgi:hypothetical protein
MRLTSSKAAPPVEESCLYQQARPFSMDSTRSEEQLTPEEWKKKMERKRKKQKEILPNESEIYEMDSK